MRESEKFYGFSLVVVSGIICGEFKISDDHTQANGTVAIPLENGDEDYIEFHMIGKLIDLCKKYIEPGCIVTLNGRLKSKPEYTTADLKYSQTGDDYVNRVITGIRMNHYIMVESIRFRSDVKLDDKS